VISTRRTFSWQSVFEKVGVTGGSDIFNDGSEVPIGEESGLVDGESDSDRKDNRPFESLKTAVATA
jgi:hypothetical protein